jgi:multimeric flavodoxin WrbA
MDESSVDGGTMGDRKRVLGVVGSPRRKGNTHLLVARILEGAQAGGAETELVFLNDLAIRECDGCHACWAGRDCSKNDDMNGIYPKIADSEVTVFGTPVYWYGPTALMKAFIDRLVYFNCPENHTKIAGKSAVLAVPFEESNPDTASLLVQLFERSLAYLDVDLVAKILVPGVTVKGEIVDRAGPMDEAFAMGQRLARPV